MYLPPHFDMTDTTAQLGFIAQHPLGTLVTLGQDGITANHLPFLHEQDGSEFGRLIAHVARNNPLWREHPHDIPVLAIFGGPAAYISPNWYATKQLTHEVVPTYNYAVVHAHGQLIVHDDAKWVRGAIGKLTKTMEATQERPWKMADAPSGFIAAQVTAIVGIEIPIDRLVAKWKLSQNRSIDDRNGAIAGLRAMDDDVASETADMMSSLL